jgi:peptidoglycan/LPS O-acetylase OafA/YrhL
LKEHLPALTGLRFLLALWVILHHLSGPGGALYSFASSLPHPAYFLIRGGYLAVATFFVLSGFVLAHGYGSGDWPRERLRRYAIARFARIYPVYAFSLILVAPFIIADRTPGKVGLIANYGLLLQGWVGHQPVGWNTPAWSLSCEVFFYFCFPLFGWVTKAAVRSRGMIGLTVVACVLPRLLLAAGMRDEWKPLVHLADFLMGIAAWAIYLRLRSGDRIQTVLTLLPLAAVAASLMVIAWPQLLPQSVDLNSALRPLNALLIAGLAAGSGFAVRWLSTPWPVYLGKASYAMYILHIPLVWWTRRWLPGFSAGLYLLAVVLVALLVYRYVEEPVNRYIRSRA